MATFGERLRELRQKAGLTQEGLADASGLPLGSIRNYEQGQREPYWSVVFKLAEALGVSCEAFKECAEATEPPAAQTPRPRGRPRKAVGDSSPQQKPHGKATAQGQPIPLSGEPKGERVTARRKKPRG